MEEAPRKRRLMGEINVVPLIDVMLVLLVIFMATAPLLTQGVQVELPRANATPLPPSPCARPPGPCRQAAPVPARFAGRPRPVWRAIARLCTVRDVSRGRAGPSP